MKKTNKLIFLNSKIGIKPCFQFMLKKAQDLRKLSNHKLLIIHQALTPRIISILDQLILKHHKIQNQCKKLQFKYLKFLKFK